MMQRFKTWENKSRHLPARYLTPQKVYVSHSSPESQAAGYSGKALDKFSVSRAAVILGTFTLFSRLVGLWRDRLFASRFGAGDILDVYYVAFRVPDFVFNLLILGTLSVAFIPVFTEVLLNDLKRANNISNTVLNSSFLLISAVCLLLFFLVNPITKLLVPGFGPEIFAQTVLLTKFFLFSPIIFTLSNVFGSILNAKKRFFIVGLAPILYNFGIIFGLLWLYPRLGLTGLALGVILGALLHLLIQVAENFRLNFKWQPIIDLKDAATRKIIRLFLPRIFGMDNSQISLLIGSAVGSILASGSIAVFNLANNLQAVPIGIFAISSAIAAFPLLSENFAQKDEAEFVQNLQKSITQILFFIIPISVLILLLRAHIVRLAFGSGEFDWNDTILTFKTLGVFTVSLFAQSLTPLLARAFYARQNTLLPVIINFAGMLLNAGLAFFLGKKIGVVGVAIAFSAAAIFNCLVLFVALRIQLKKFADSWMLKQIVRTSLASAVMGLLTYGSLYVVEPLLNTRTVLGLLAQFVFAASVGAIGFFICAYLLKLKQAVYIVNILKRKL